ncbi:hypothetical protein [Brevibacillus laterosporus]|uniref:Uncharacterized protein n=1 Tax=Brevibacillus laterosporus LMG 15441 TaxID=1042163 RepID=A0A075R4Q5_BRELA|nr:hypothetical protein [Brevibacillus laterosporus]AIG26471.1 hypothetical protein BRLA_c021500 [Brevibacillus laterosporus LMG 15441]RJL07621.1 hypothetical protein DM460_20010 [Brevibacillus laterosporus]
MTSRNTPGSLILDAFYVDEFGVQNASHNIDSRMPRGTPLLHKNKFTSVHPLRGGGVIEFAESVRMPDVTNKANPRHNPSLTGQWVQTNIPSGHRDTHPVWLFLSASTLIRARELRSDQPWDTPIRVSILYAVGFEMNRHGLRSAIATHPEPSALVVVPGIEPPLPRWGVGINDSDLMNLLKSAVSRPVTYNTKVMAAYSTGANGLNQTLLHNLIDVSQVERIIFYDCLYEKVSGNTAEALNAARRRAGPSLKIIAYKCTKNGNSLDSSFNLSVVRKNPGLIRSDGVVDLSYMTASVFPAYSALITFRALESGIADGLITLTSSLHTAFDEMKRIVPARGKVVSQSNTWSYVFGGSPPSDKVLLSSWYKDNERVIKQFYSHLGSITKSGSIRELIWGNQLPGWSGGDGEENHDLLLPDFAWEYLTP